MNTITIKSGEVTYQFTESDVMAMFDTLRDIDIIGDTRPHGVTVEKVSNIANDALRKLSVFPLESVTAAPKEVASKDSEAIEILRELCQLKHYKDEVGKDAFYEKRQPELWKMANDFLNNAPKPSTGVDADLWVSVEDRLPANGYMVMAFNGFSKQIYLGSCLDGRWIFHGQERGNITHWMPLPKSPK